MVANKLHRRLPDSWEITIVDQATSHHYQPGYLFIPFGTYQPEDIIKPTASFIPDEVRLVTGEIERVIPAEHEVVLADGTTLGYDQLVIATGTHPRLDQTPGLGEEGWRESIHDFYTLEGATALAGALEKFEGGRLVVHIAEMPIKCPPAPLEFAFLLDDYLRRRGLRDRSKITYVTPLSGAFTRPVASRYLGEMLAQRGIAVEPDFYVERVEPDRLVSFDEREVPFDLAVIVPVHMGAEFVARSGLGDELNHVRVDPGNFLADGYDSIFALGDAAALPTSKAGSVAHFAVEVFTENFLDHIAGRPMTHTFDGHANCFIESGGGKAMLIDFNYATEPLPGKYPIPKLGPLSLLRETRLNHLGKLAFKPIYWSILLPGRRLGVPTAMSMAGKVASEQLTHEKETAS